MLSRGDECGWEKGLPIVCIVACQGKDSLWTPCSCTCLFHDADSNTLPTLAHSPTQHNQGLISRLHDASKMAISFQSIQGALHTALDAPATDVCLSNRPGISCHISAENM